jgi:hypothetical protein
MTKELTQAVLERTFNELKGVGQIEPREWLVADWVVGLARKYNVKLDDFVDECLKNPELEKEFQDEFEKRLGEQSSVGLAKLADIKTIV